MAVIPPWQAVNPLDFIKAMQAGASAGSERAANMLRARQMTQPRGAADNSLGYAQLALRAQEGAAERAIAEKMAAAKLREAQVQHEAMQQYRQQLEEGRQRDDIRADAALVGRGGYQDELMEMRRSGAEATKEYRDARLGLERERIGKMGGAGAGLRRYLEASGLAPGGAAPAAPAPGGFVPTPKEQLEVGKIYPLADGRSGVWNGRGFDTVDEPGAPALPRRKPTLYTGDYLNSPDELEMLGEGAGVGFPVPRP